MDSSVLAYMDDATALAVLNAMWDDLDAVAAENAFNERLGRHHPNDAEGDLAMTDANRSLEVQKLELRAHFISRLDRLLAREWARNGTEQQESDSEPGARILKEIADKIRAKSSAGRKLADRLFEVNIDVLTPFSSGNDTNEEVSDAKFLTVLRDRAKGYPNEKDDGHEQRGTSYNDTNKNGNDPRTSQCVCCMTNFASQETVICRCSHIYCHNCLGDFFRRALTDESTFPPKCCNEPIPVDDYGIKAALGESLIAEYRDKKEELETHDRTYCSNQECLAWIPPRHFEAEIDVAKCPKCQASTCTVCKSAAHEGADCPEDEGTKTILDLAKQENWRQCYQCHRVVELTQGCWHMTCFCSAEFCYRCGRPWKTCKPDCEAWEEGDDDWSDDETPESEPESELEIVDLNMPLRLPPRGEVIQLDGAQDAEVQNAEFEDAMLSNDEFLENGFQEAGIQEARFQKVGFQDADSSYDDCDHAGRWHRVEGRHRCQNCLYRLPHFAEMCHDCHLLLCRRCRQAQQQT